MKNHNQHPKPKLSADEIEVRIWGFVVIMITLILAGIVFALLYSVTFVTQPIKSMAPIDMAYTKMLNDIVLLIVGGIGGIVGKRAVGAMHNAVSPPPTFPMAQPIATPVQVPVQVPVQQGFNWMGFQNPTLDESWTPPPPPTTHPTLQEADEDRAHTAAARKETE